MSSKERKECQLAELELLMSMFPNKGELEFDDPSEMADLRHLVDSDSASQTCQSTSVGFKLRLSADQHPVEITCRLPSDYPISRPVVCVRSASQSSSQQRDFNAALQTYISQTLSESDNTNITISEIIQWITVNVNIYAIQSTSDSFDNNSDDARVPFGFARLWIYSHHIYNRSKRRTILDSARELKLSGFCAPGKPGIICVEGECRNTEKFWQQIRSLQWQRISLIHREDFPSSVEKWQHFMDFDEKCFISQQSTNSRHMDRGLLLQFLRECGCAYVFRFYFGIDGTRDAVTGDRDKNTLKSCTADSDSD